MSTLSFGWLLKNPGFTHTPLTLLEAWVAWEKTHKILRESTHNIHAKRVMVSSQNHTHSDPEGKQTEHRTAVKTPRKNDDNAPNIPYKAHIIGALAIARETTAELGTVKSRQRVSLVGRSYDGEDGVAICAPLFSVGPDADDIRDYYAEYQDPATREECVDVATAADDVHYYYAGDDTRLTNPKTASKESRKFLQATAAPGHPVLSSGLHVLLADALHYVRETDEWAATRGLETDGRARFEKYSSTQPWWMPDSDDLQGHRVLEKVPALTVWVPTSALRMSVTDIWASAAGEHDEKPVRHVPEP